MCVRVRACACVCVMVITGANYLCVQAVENVCVCVGGCTQSYTHMHAQSHTHGGTRSMCASGGIWVGCMWTQSYIHTHMHACTHTVTHTYTHTVRRDEAA